MLGIVAFIQHMQWLLTGCFPCLCTSKIVVRTLLQIIYSWKFFELKIAILPRTCFGSRPIISSLVKGLVAKRPRKHRHLYSKIILLFWILRERLYNHSTCTQPFIQQPTKIWFHHLKSSEFYLWSYTHIIYVVRSRNLVTKSSVVLS